MQATSLLAADPQGAVLRDATLADAPALADLVEALNRSEGDPTGYVTAETMARDLARGEIAVVVAESEGAIVGYCLHHFGYEPTYAASGRYICDLYVVEAWRRRGIARALVAEVARRGKAAGGSFVWWTAKPGNDAANAAYARLGSFSEPLIAHAVFDDAFETLAAAGAARLGGEG
jgi:ribosomal protein S18 acetylase RimI-like enzyme